MSTICLRFPNGQRCSRHFRSDAPCSQLVAYAGTCINLIPEELYDTDSWGVFTAHPRHLLSGQMLNSSLQQLGLHPRALLHVGQLPLEYDRSSIHSMHSGGGGDGDGGGGGARAGDYSSGGSQDFMDVDL